MRAIFPAVMLALYGVATLSYIVHLFWHDDRLRRAGRLSFALGLVAHLGTIGSRCVAGSHPLLDTSGVLSLSGLLVGVFYVSCSYRWRLAAVGPVVAAFALMLAISSALTLQATPAPGGPDTVLLLRHLHLVSVAASVAAIGLAAAVSMLYLRREEALKSGRFNAHHRQGPAITALDDLGLRLVLIGFPLVTLALVTGVVWALRLPGPHFRIDYVVAGGMWLVFAGVIVGRWASGMRGRRAALLTVVGAAALGLVLALYVGRRVLG